MKRKIQAVIFDLDGLIVDSEPPQSLSWEILLAERDIKPIYNKQGLIHEVGPTGDKSYLAVMKKHNIKKAELETVRKRRREIFEEIIRKKLKPMPGFLNLIKILKKEKIKLALASNRINIHANLMLDIIGAKDFFKVIVCRNDNIKAKPSPHIFLETAKKLKLKTSQCLVLEDSEIGIIAAKKAKMKVIAVPSKYTIDNNFSKADKIVKSLKEIDIPLIMSL